jgi:hypothetical protein
VGSRGGSKNILGAVRRTSSWPAFHFGGDEIGAGAEWVGDVAVRIIAGSDAALIAKAGCQVRDTAPPQEALQSEARRRGTTEGAVVEELLRARLPAPASLAEVVEEWLAEDQTSDEAELERREWDLAALKDGLNAAHASDRTLFP